MHLVAKDRLRLTRKSKISFKKRGDTKFRVENRVYKKMQITHVSLEGSGLKYLKRRQGLVVMWITRTRLIQAAVAKQLLK